MRQSVIGMLMAMALFCGGCPADFCGGGGGTQAEASLYVSDAATGQPVRAPAFSENGAALEATCGETELTAPPLCNSELLLLEAGTVHSVVVSAPGYRSETVSLDLSGPDSVHLAVELHAIPRNLQLAEAQ